jgi:C4-dicarboxylate-specific signal transduction histidine kinase
MATPVGPGRHAARLRSRLSTLSRADLEAQVTELLAQQSAISEVLRTIANSPNDLQPVFDTIVANATRLCRSEGAILRMVDEEGLLLVSLKQPPELAASYSPPLRVDHNSPIGRLPAHKSTVHIPNLGEHELFRAGDPTMLSLFKGGLRTVIIVPMVDEDEMIGIISLGRQRIEPFTEEEIDLITDFAAEAAIALGIIRRERDLREVQMELARANRIATMGQLSSSIAHEVIQPIAAARTNARAALRFLDKQRPELGEARNALDGVVAEADRAGDIIHRIRDHINKAPPQTDRLDMNEAIRDAIMLTRGEAVKSCVSIQTQLAEGLPFLRGDRVQVQQVMVNLIVNAIQAMSGAGDRRRELQISTETDEAEGVRVGVRDTGPGLAPENLLRVFEPFYTTKAEGMGMGLPICRSIVEAHGGRLWATACEPHGALFQFTIPAEQDATS